MEMDCSDEGTNKEKNKSLADAFHMWSRSKLSSQLVKQDFDAIYNGQDGFSMKPAAISGEYLLILRGIKRQGK